MTTMDGQVHDVGRWDLLIAHPPCTDLAASGARWFPEKQRTFAQQKSIVFLCGLRWHPLTRLLRKTL